MDRSDASALADLQMHWDEAYTIGLDGDIWLARFHGSADELRAHTSTELRQLIRADYAYRQQARRRSAPAAGATVVAGSPGDPDSDHGRGGGGHSRQDSGPDGADLDDDELDNDDYAAHYDSAHADSAHPDSAHPDGDEGGGHQHDAEPDRQAGFGRAASPRDNYADLRGERMST